MYHMENPVVLITGALTGIGYATALAFTHNGACIVVSGRHDEEGNALAQELRDLGGEAEFVRADVRHDEEVQNLVDPVMGQKAAPGASVYAASKHAVEGMTKAAALETASSGVRVNAVAPGPVETGMLNRFTGSAERKASLIAGIPAQRAGTPDEVAQTILFLGSDKAPFLTGQVIAVDGGKLAS